MSRLEIILSAILFISLLLNVGLMTYARKVVSELIAFSEELGDLQQMITSFTNHLQSVYELEMFYGDATLEHLLEHASSFADQMETFEYIYSLTDQPELEDMDTNDEEETDTET